MDFPFSLKLNLQSESRHFPLILLVRNSLWAYHTLGDGLPRGGGVAGAVLEAACRGAAFRISRPRSYPRRSLPRGSLLHLPASVHRISFPPILPGSPDAFISESGPGLPWRHLFSLPLSPAPETFEPEREL